MFKRLNRIKPCSQTFHITTDGLQITTDILWHAFLAAVLVSFQYTQLRRTLKLVEQWTKFVYW
jgi:hypothetical protein